MQFDPPSRPAVSQSLRRDSRRVLGWVVPILAVLLSANFGETSFAGCSHYVQDRLHPNVGRETTEQSLRQSHVHNKHRLPCQGPNCRAPQLPMTPTTLSVVVTIETVRTVAVSVSTIWNFELSTRPTFDRPRSERIVVAPLRNILRPPC